MFRIYYHNEIPYKVLKVLKAHHVSPKGYVDMDLLKEWRDCIGADHVLKKDGEFWLCHTVQEPEWEEIVEETNSPVEV